MHFSFLQNKRGNGNSKTPKTTSCYNGSYGDCNIFNVFCYTGISISCNVWWKSIFDGKIGVASCINQWHQEGKYSYRFKFFFSTFFINYIFDSLGCI